MFTDIVVEKIYFLQFFVEFLVLLDSFIIFILYASSRISSIQTNLSCSNGLNQINLS